MNTRFPVMDSLTCLASQTRFDRHPVNFQSWLNPFVIFCRLP